MKPTLKRLLAGSLLGAAWLCSACTVRYSQSLTGAIPKGTGTEVRSQDTGFALFEITLSEPTPAHQQVVSLMGQCSRLTRVEVDYRSLSFILFSIPRVTVTGLCEP
jgi:hypothetical protein